MTTEQPEATPDMPAVERVALAVMAFSFAAMNGSPFFASAGVFCAIGTIVLAASHIRRNGLSYAIPRGAALTVQLWGLWVFAATAGMLANLGPRTLDTWAWAYLLPFVMMISVLVTRPSRKDVWIILAALLTGWTIRFGYGVYVFYSTWGSIGVDDMMAAHFNLARYAPYADATYGSTGRTAALIVPALICTCLSMLLLKASNLARFFMFGTSIILAMSGLIVGSRAFFIVTIMVVAIAAFRSSAGRGAVVLAVLVAASASFVTVISTETRGRFLSVLTGSRLADTSVSERYDSMVEGYHLMIDNVFGIGPGMSSEVLYYSVAHQFAIFQGSELGVLGFFAVIILYIWIAIRFLMSSSASGFGMRYIFRAGAFGWFTFAMLANSPMSEGSNIPWIALPALLLALSEVAPRDRIGLRRTIPSTAVSRPAAPQSRSVRP